MILERPVYNAVAVRDTIKFQIQSPKIYINLGAFDLRLGAWDFLLFLLFTHIQRNHPCHFANDVNQF
jgi:hypothetical protein